MSTLYVQDTAGVYTPAGSDIILREARNRIARKFRRGSKITAPTDSKAFLQLQLANEENECFACIFLDNQHRVIQFRRLFEGTIDGTSVYPRVVVQQALACNAAALIFAHNHPSGLATPSRADKAITEKLQNALKLMDIRVLDHWIIAGDDLYSFAEAGLLDAS